MTSYKGKDKDNFFLCEGRFGPAELPTDPSLAALLVDYDRQLNGNPKGFLEQFWGTSWRWPNAYYDGFLTETSTFAITLGPGTLLDRFGQEDTAYFAPFGTPYAMRSLPPSSLNDPYTVYRVLKPFLVRAGPIAPGFRQPGLGTQYIARQNAAELVAAGIIQALNENELQTLREKRPDEPKH